MTTDQFGHDHHDHDVIARMMTAREHMEALAAQRRRERRAVLLLGCAIGALLVVGVLQAVAQ